MPVEFYDVKTRSKVTIEDKKISKTTFQSDSGVRYGLRGETADGRKLTKFVSKADWDAMKVPEEKAPAKKKEAEPKKAEEKPKAAPAKAAPAKAAPKKAEKKPEKKEAPKKKK